MQNEWGECANDCGRCFNPNGRSTTEDVKVVMCNQESTTGYLCEPDNHACLHGLDLWQQEDAETGTEVHGQNLSGLRKYAHLFA
jgi:hypothetical protein